MSVTAKEVIGAWAVALKGEATNVYLSAYRAEYLDDLVTRLLKCNIDFESAKSIRSVNEVIARLVTRLGQKGKGKHAGWKDQVAKEYVASLMERYPIEQIANPDSLARPIEYNSLIDLWGEYYYGKMYGGVIRDYANTPGHYINMKFKAEVLDAEWPRTLNQIPEWAQSAIDKGQLTVV
jgi:hypothetical protein